MITFFSIPKPFSGPITVIQRNAIRSWLAGPGSTATLFGDEPGVAEAALEFGAEYRPEIRRNAQGTPLLDQVFARARAEAKTPLLSYINADILILPGFLRSAAELLRLFSGKPFLAVGRRTDLEINSEINFALPNWDLELQTRALRQGQLHGWSGIDYFLFPPSLDITLPPFPVGRPGWDNWFIAQTLKLGVPVIDATKAMTVIHQNHPPAYRQGGAEASMNIALAGGLADLCTIYNASHVFTGHGVSRPSAGRRLFTFLSTRNPFKYLIGLKRRAIFLITKCKN